MQLDDGEFVTIFESVEIPMVRTYGYKLIYIILFARVINKKTKKVESNP